MSEMIQMFSRLFYEEMKLFLLLQTQILFNAKEIIFFFIKSEKSFFSDPKTWKT